MSGFCSLLSCALLAAGAPAVPKQSTPAASSPAANSWPVPDVSLKRQADGKESVIQNARAHILTADSLYREKRYAEAASEYEKGVDIDHRDFRANFFLGLSYYQLRRYDDAVKALKRAREVNPEAFETNLWLGVSLARARAFKEAIPNLEKARELKPDNELARRELFLSYLGGGEPEKAGQLYPQLARMIGGVFLVIYCVWLGALLPFSLPIGDKTFPGFWLFLGWGGLFFEGQIAFLLILASLPWLRLHETVLSGAILAGLPIILFALAGFARQPWGGPFRWPPRFGSPKIVLISVMLVFGVVFIGIANAQVYSQLTNKPFPLQRIIPLIRNALNANPAVAWLAIALVIPFVEEILFRGLLFGAFEKHWGVKAAVLGSSLVFVLAHFQIIGFLPLLFLGLILAWARLKSRSLALPIALHSLNNAIAVAALTFAPAGPN